MAICRTSEESTYFNHVQKYWKTNETLSFTENKYGLKVLNENDGTIVNSHISEDNFNQIKNGFSLKLAYSLSFYVHYIFDHLNDSLNKQIFDDLYTLSFDPEFIKEMVKLGKHTILLDYFTNKTISNEKELVACLVAIVHLFQKKNITDISPIFLENVIQIARNVKSIEPTKYALSLIHKILCSRDAHFAKWKEVIINEMSIKELLSYIQIDSRELQHVTLLLINTIIKLCKGDKKLALIKEIDSEHNRECIFKYIIYKGNIDKNMAHELYVYQTFLLSKHVEALNSSISEEDASLIARKEFEINIDDVGAVSMQLDFCGDSEKDKNESMENLSVSYNDLRLSLASFSSNQSEDNISIRTSTANCRSFADINARISKLTLEALRYYKRHYIKNFHQSQIEEKEYEPGIFVTSETVIHMLAQLLHIGREPDRQSVHFQPVIFNSGFKTSFFFELFSRTMWLLSKTRREMRASTIDDFSKVINVLEKQVQLALEEKPKDYKQLTEKMTIISFNTVMQYWQKEKNQEMEETLSTNICIRSIREHFTFLNQKLVLQQRVNFLKNEEKFPKILEKKISGHFTSKLSDNENQLIISEFPGERKIYTVTSITYVVQGKACPHVSNNLVKDCDLAFSIIIDHNYINFIAKDRKTAAYWVDGLNLLIGKEASSKFYKEELENLTKMDLLIHLIELQNIPIPKKPPQLPLTNPENKQKPPVPKRPEWLQ